ncbi:hypothetical protein FS749_000625 [Ceratobasidium sp. UAMH 11750]|nr:hypothetical protein FS749_000625 [Ceratobasidium sp. UAMH 11750]
MTLRNVVTALTTRRPRRSRTSRLRPGIFMIDEVPNLIDENAQAHPQADVLLLVGLSSKIGQVEALAKSLASSAGALGRRVVYVGQEKLFKSSWAQYVDVYLQLDPQEWARRQLEAFQSQGSAQQSGRDMLESFLVPPPKAFSLGEKVGEYLESGSPNSCSLCLKDDLDVVHPCRVCHTGYCMQGPTAQEITSCVQLGNLDVTLDLTDTDVDKLIKTFLCPGCYIPSPGKEYPHLIRNPPFHVPDPPRHPRMVLVVFYITEFRLVATNLARQIAYTWYERGWEVNTSSSNLHLAVGYHHAHVDTSQWAFRTYRVFVIYLTHALSNDFTLQTSGVQAQPVDVLLDWTRAVMTPVLVDAASVDAALLCCGYLFTCSKQMTILQTYLSG